MGTTAGCSLKNLFDSVLPPSSSWRWQQRRYSWLVDTFLSVVMLTSWVWHGSGCPGPLLNLFRNLPWTAKISFLDFLYSDLIYQFEGSMITSENRSASRESSRVIILKSRLNSKAHSACTSKVRDIFDRQARIPSDWWQLICLRVLQPWGRHNSTTAPVRNTTLQPDPV